MKKLIPKAFFLILVLALFLPAANAQQDKPVKTSYNIEGIFQCDFNGKYYVRQIGNEILWFGEDDNVNPLWSNVAHGTIGSGDIINLIWADVPKGSIMQYGKLKIKIISNNEFELISQEGDNFGSSHWNRITQ